MLSGSQPLFLQMVLFKMGIIIHFLPLKGNALVFDSSTNGYSTELMLGTMNMELKRIQLVDIRCFNMLFHTFMSKFDLINIQRCRSQNAEKVTHIKGRVLDQAMVLFNCVPFQNRKLLLKERICSQRERILSFMSSSL